MIKYAFELNEEHLDSSLRRHRRLKKMDLWQSPLKLIAGLGLAMLIYGVFNAGSWVAGSVLALLLVLLIVSPALSYRSARRSFQKSPHFGERVSFAWTEHGYTRTDSLSHAELAWSTIREAHRLRDGYLVLIAPQGIHWLPDSALDGNGPEALGKLFETHLKGYRNVAG